MHDLMKVGFISEHGKITQDENGATTLAMQVKAGIATFTFFTDREVELEEQFVIEYSCYGWRRGNKFRAPFITAIKEDGEEIPVAILDDFSTDMNKYRVISKVTPGKYKSLKFVFLRHICTTASFTIYDMYTCKNNEIPEFCEKLVTDSARDFSVIDLDGYFNAECACESFEYKVGGGRAFTKENLKLANIPFKVKLEGNNIVKPSAPPAENDEIINNFGAMAKRRLCRPISRDSLDEIKIGKKVSEIFLIIAMDGWRYERHSYATDGTILGTYGKEVTRPILVDDIEGYAVEIVYANGNRDLCLPMNLSIGKHGIAGDVSVYAVPADGSEVESIILHNRRLDTEFSLMALTVNETDERLFPNITIPELPEKIVHTVGTETYIKRDGEDRIAIKNGGLYMLLDIKSGLKIIDFNNDYAPSMTCENGGLLRQIKPGEVVCEDFEYIDSKVENDKAELTYASGALRFHVTMYVTEENGVHLGLDVTNTSDEQLVTGVLFPCVSGIQFATSDDGWYFTPKYQNLDSNEDSETCEESSPAFPMQFLDVYSKQEQGGLCVNTRERELIVRKYRIEKYLGKIKMAVDYPTMYGKIKPHETFTCSPTVLSVHEGDWHASFEKYTKWLASWYEPYHCQDKQWYRECFWLLAEITDFFETKEFTQFPIWFDEEKKKFNYLDILEEQKEISGYYPDILHMWKWTGTVAPDGKGMSGGFGNYNESDYERYGGKEKLRDALKEFNEKTGVYPSVYLHPTLLSSAYPQFKDYEHLTVVSGSGRNITIGDAYRMCHANDEWRDYALDMYERVYNDLKSPILYVDEFSLRIGNRCYADGHGHEIPSNLLKTDREFITRLKDRMPHDVVLYGEYAAVDVNARYIDCNISYSMIDAVVAMIETSWRANNRDDRMSRVLTDLYRFAFPKIVQLVLPMAMRNMSWHPQKFIFFNGEAIYDSLWDLEESAGHEFTCKAFGIKKKYADCFSSDTPETMVETLSPAICANKFPGKGRTVYTIYNRAYSTYRGKILHIPHVEGAKYYDVWNGEELKVDIKDGYADIYLTIHGQSIGCIEISNN